MDLFALMEDVWWTHRSWKWTTLSSQSLMKCNWVKASFHLHFKWTRMEVYMRKAWAWNGNSYNDQKNIENPENFSFIDNLLISNQVIYYRHMWLSGTWNQNTRALRAGTSLTIDPLFYRQIWDNARDTFTKPPDIYHQNQNEGVILIPGFLCNPWVMRTLG